MLGIPLGILYANGVEWVMHKHVLHGLGKDKKSLWAFHWHEHHGASRQHEMLDEHYIHGSWTEWNSKTKEAVALVLGALVHAPLLPVAPFFTLTVWAWGANYYRVHRKSHLDPEWGRQHLPWHYDHHMGPNQHANWGVTYPLWDIILGTREVYLGTERWREDTERRAKVKARRDAAAASSSAPPEGVPDAEPSAA